MEGAREQQGRGGAGGVSTRAASWLAWSLCGLSLVLTALSLFLFALNLFYSGAHDYDYYWFQNAVQAFSFSIIGAIIASRLPANPVGWLFCAAACTIAVECLSAEYAIYTLVARPESSLPIGEALAWLAFWAWIPSIGCIVLSLLLFPNGRLPSSRWRWLAWLSVLLTIAGAVWVALSPGASGNLESIRNPLGIEGLPSGYKPVQTIMSALLLVAAVSTLGLRLLRTRGIEHQQIKWPAFVAVVAAGGSVLHDTAISKAIGLRWLEWAGYVGLIAALVCFPMALRDRYPHKPHPRLRIAHGDIGSGLLRCRCIATEGVRCSHRPTIYPRSRGIHPAYSGPIYSVKASHPVLHRQALLPQEVRCHKDPRSLLCQA